MAVYTVAEFASTLEANPREVRKFLRSITPVDDQPGKGARWSIEKRDARRLTKAYHTWSEARKVATEDAPLDEIDDAEVIDA
jgi:hypothetical protein